MIGNYSKQVIRDGLLADIARLKTMQPDNENVKRNIANIEKQKPLDQADENFLRGYLDLLHRSIP